MGLTLTGKAAPHQRCPRSSDPSSDHFRLKRYSTSLTAEANSWTLKFAFPFFSSPNFRTPHGFTDAVQRPSVLLVAVSGPCCMPAGTTAEQPGGSRAERQREYPAPACSGQTATTKGEEHVPSHWVIIDLPGGAPRQKPSNLLSSSALLRDTSCLLTRRCPPLARPSAAALYLPGPSQPSLREPRRTFCSEAGPARPP